MPSGDIGAVLEDSGRALVLASAVSDAPPVGVELLSATTLSSPVEDSPQLGSKDKHRDRGGSVRRMRMVRRGYAPRADARDEAMRLGAEPVSFRMP